MPESKIYDTNPVKHVVVDDRYHMALKIYALKHGKTSKEIVEESRPPEKKPEEAEQEQENKIGI